ncbi:MAG: biosynthetic peptidoglycan transglycosylase, partial [Roseobacter sp.]
MSDSSKRRRPLVADKRYVATKAKPAKRKAATRKKPKRRTPKRRGGIIGFFQRIIRWCLRLIWRITWRVGFVAALALGLMVGYYYTTLPPVDELLDGRARGSVTLLDREGAVFAWRGDQFGGVVTAQTVSPHLKNAIVATEDRRFYKHVGLSPRGIASAVRINLSEGRGPLSGHGGSTITQQVAKLLCLGVPYDPEVQTEEEYERDCRRGTIQRKAKEAIYALAMEAKYSKDEI